MKRHLCRASWLVAIVLAAPRPAHAGIIDFLDRLSGPGPFLGFEAGICLKAIDIHRPPGSRATQPEDRGLHPETIIFPCRDPGVDRPHLSWYFNTGVSRSLQNHLDYDASTKGSKVVWLLKEGTSLDYTLLPAVDVGAGVGFYYFAGRRFDNFTRAYAEPLRISIRPLLFRKTSELKPEALRRAGYLLFQVTWVKHLGTLDGADFGAPLDSFHTHNENNWQFGISLEVLKLLSK